MRHLFGILVGAGICLPSQFANAQNLSTFGTPGIIDMPSADVLPDGELAFTTSVFQDTARNTLLFQFLPWAYGTFRYSYIRDFDDPLSRYDRSFDLHFRLRKETKRGPAIAVGIRDIGGTGIYGSEYVVLTKTFADRWKVSGGMGWGRLGTRNGFSNPLGSINDRFDTRPPPEAGGGQLNTGLWFRGDAALFAGVEYRHSDKLTLLAEYSSDAYDLETKNIGFDAEFPLNVGARYSFDNGLDLSGFVLYGSTIGLQLSYTHDPRSAAAPGGFDAAAPVLRPEDQVALASWNLPEESSNSAKATATDVLRARLEKQGIRLVGYRSREGTAAVEVVNNRYNASPQALGRTAKAMANTLPPSIDTFRITLSRDGLPITSVEIDRSDLYDLENDLDGAWRTLVRSQIRDDIEGLSGSYVEDAFPYSTYRFAPYGRFSFFDPDDPLRYEFGLEFEASYVPIPGLSFSTKLRQPLLNTLDDTTRGSNSVLPRVRSDWARYAQESNFQVNTITAEYLWRPKQDVFARVTGGYLEEMFGGLSAEVLWSPGDSRLALGGEINYVRQRDFDMLFGFQDYEIVTGHASLYYNLPGEYIAQIDAGRYLAGDWGATFGLDREFNNGFKIGAFFTLTDVSSEDFGEGSFDKGIRFEIPLALFNGKSNRTKFEQVIRPLLRDGGARLKVPNRLFEYTREERAGRLIGQWGRFYR